ncbi:MAG: hypothetical protein ACREOF_00620 [Gemmatimonadales bacterium]
MVPGLGEYISIALDGAGRVHLTYRDRATDGLGYASCAAACDDPGNWEQSVVELGGNTGFATSLQVEADGRLHVVYTDFALRNLKYAPCAASCCGPANWTIVTIDQTTSFTNSLIRDAAGRLHVAYELAQFSQPSYLGYATCSADCTTSAGWQTTTVDPEDAGLIAAALALDGAGRLHASYVHRPLGAGRGSLRYATCADSCAEPANWTLATVDGSGEVQPYTSIATPDGRVHVAFISQDPGRLRYASCSTECGSLASWTAIPIDPATVVLNDVHVRAGPDGRIHLVYSDDDAVDFKYATCVADCASPASWEFTTLASEGNVGTSSALLIDRAGGVHIAYRDASNGSVNYIE